MSYRVRHADLASYYRDDRVLFSRFHLRDTSRFVRDPRFLGSRERILDE